MSLSANNLYKMIKNPKFLKAALILVITLIAIVYILPMAGIYSIPNDNGIRPETGDYALYEVNEDNAVCQTFATETRRLYSMYFYCLYKFL